MYQKTTWTIAIFQSVVTLRTQSVNGITWFRINASYIHFWVNNPSSTVCEFPTSPQVFGTYLITSISKSATELTNLRAYHPKPTRSTRHVKHVFIPRFMFKSGTVWETILSMIRSKTRKLTWVGCACGANFQRRATYWV